METLLWGLGLLVIAVVPLLIRHYLDKKDKSKVVEEVDIKETRPKAVEEVDIKETRPYAYRYRGIDDTDSWADSKRVK